MCNSFIILHLGRIISSNWAVPKSKLCEKPENSQEDAKDEEGSSSKDAWKADNESSNIRDGKITREKDKLKMQRKRKLLKKKRQKKRARIVIRNLSFKVSIKKLHVYHVLCTRYTFVHVVKICIPVKVC